MRAWLSIVVLVGCVSTPAPRVEPVAAPPRAAESLDEAKARCLNALPGCADPTAAEEWMAPPPPRPCQGIPSPPLSAVRQGRWICVCRCVGNDGCAADQTCARRPLGYFQGEQTCGPPIDAGSTIPRPPEMPCVVP